jgi:hypothetical protein
VRFAIFRLEWRRGNCMFLPTGQTISDKSNKGNAEFHC